MKVKALKSFGGKISMAIGEEREIDDKVILSDLIDAGFVKEIKAEKKTEKAKSAKAKK